MQETQNKKSEVLVSKAFDNLSGHFDKADEKGLDKTAIKHISQITKDSSNKIVLDVGSGAGGILDGLLDKNIDFVYGVDLSPKMIELAKQRLEKKGYLSKAKLENISFLDFTFEKKTDAISFHKVLCCHPDRTSMLQKAINGSPQVIVITIPRNRLFFRFGAFVLHILRKIKHGFTFYVHDPKLIDQQLQAANYQLVDVFKTFVWMTRTYILQS